ncbi:Hypothetical_protein [Hexamita inflata]|uniref:Hypothetical_protein n=1 Tax=Hexamita inflata TaxID=28002 RepID=A0AA86QP67_9EUKA|nr:Hypothetical protein HINF_LOCUS47982 [Hexamita inflata]
MSDTSNLRGLTDDENQNIEEIAKVKREQTEYKKEVKACSRSQSPVPIETYDFNLALKDLNQTKQQIEMRCVQRNAALELNIQYKIELAKMMREPFLILINQYLDQMEKDPTLNQLNYQKLNQEMLNQYQIELNKMMKDPTLDLNIKYHSDLVNLVDNQQDQEWVFQKLQENLFEQSYEQSQSSTFIDGSKSSKTVFSSQKSSKNLEGRFIQQIGSQIVMDF